MASRRRRSRRSWSHRVRRGLVQHRSSVFRCALGVAVLAELWLLWPDPGTVRSISAAQQRARHQSVAAGEPSDGLVAVAQASVAVSAKRQLVGRAGVGQYRSSRGCGRSPRRCRTSACLTRRRSGRRLPRATRRPSLRTPSRRSLRRRERSACGTERRRCTRRSDGRASRSGYGAGRRAASGGWNSELRPRRAANLRRGLARPRRAASCPIGSCRRQRPTSRSRPPRQMPLRRSRFSMRRPTCTRTTVGRAHAHLAAQCGRAGGRLAGRRSPW